MRSRIQGDKKRQAPELLAATCCAIQSFVSKLLLPAIFSGGLSLAPLVLATHYTSKKFATVSSSSQDTGSCIVERRAAATPTSTLIHLTSPKLAFVSPIAPPPKNTTSRGQIMAPKLPAFDMDFLMKHACTKQRYTHAYVFVCDPRKFRHLHCKLSALYACAWEEKESERRTRETWSKAEIAEFEMPDTSSLARFMIDGYILPTATTFPSHRCLYACICMHA